MGIIYGIYNLCNVKVYVGKTERLLVDRFQDHISDARSGRDTAPLLQRAMRKYGVDLFYPVQLDTCAADVAILNNLEIAWIAKLNAASRNSGYNLTLGGTGGKPNDETREKLRKPKSDAHCLKISIVAKRRGTAHMNTVEARNRKAVKLVGRKFSLETRSKMAASAKARLQRERNGGLDHLTLARAARRPLLRNEHGRYTARCEGGKPSFGSLQPSIKSCSTGSWA
jgi:group I intron endonuclease